MFGSKGRQQAAIRDFKRGKTASARTAQRAADQARAKKTAAAAKRANPSEFKKARAAAAKRARS